MDPEPFDNDNDGYYSDNENNENEDEEEKHVPILECPFCARIFGKERNLELHIRFHHIIHISKKKPKTLRIPRNSSASMSLSCNKCDKTFTTLWNLRMHLKVVHHDHNVYQCNKCDESFTDATALSSHIRATHELKQFECDYCDKVFASRRSKQRHVDATHLGIKRSCKLCDKDFMTHSGLKAHIKIVHEKVTGPQSTCHMCGKMFSRKTHLRNHILSVHEGVKNFQCDKCERSFVTNAQLKRHYKGVHTGIKDEQCPHCDKAFSLRSTLRVHLVNVHKIKEGQPVKLGSRAERENLTVKCEKEDCGKMFASQKRMKVHMRFVHRPGRFKCELCDATYKEGKGLRKHMRRDHKINDEPVPPPGLVDVIVEKSTKEENPESV